MDWIAGDRTSLVASATVNITSDYTKCESYPLQKTQFGASYVGLNDTSQANLYIDLKARNVRGFAKKLVGQWTGWDANGYAMYSSGSGVVVPLTNSFAGGAIDTINLQGPYEHPARLHYRLGNDTSGDYSGTAHTNNLWDWDLYSTDTKLYWKHLRDTMKTGTKLNYNYPFIFGFGHEPNNDANIADYGAPPGCLDGIAFMKNLNSFHDLVVTQGKRIEGDIIQAETFFDWYTNSVKQIEQAAGGRRKFLVTAPQVHTSSSLKDGFLNRFHELVNGAGWIYKPDFIGCHARWNLRGQDWFFNKVVVPSRDIFDDQPLWLTAPIMCNEFCIYDYEDGGREGFTATPEKYKGTQRGAVLLLNNFERMLESPDIAYVNFQCNGNITSSDGTELYPAFHAFRFYQNMPQSRTKVTTSKDLAEKGMHVLASRAIHSVQSALIWTDETNTVNRTVNFTFTNVNAAWTRAKAHLYVMNSNVDVQWYSANDGYGPSSYKVSGYPKMLNSFAGSYTFSNIVLPPGAIALLTLERLDSGGVASFSDGALANDGPANAQYIKTWQWTARNGAGGVDPSWGYFDTKNWTLFAGIDSIAGSDGSVKASYLDDPNTKVKRGMAGVEFKAASNTLQFKVNVETGSMNPSTRDYDSIGAIRVDFYNGTDNTYDAAVIFAGNRCPTKTQYSEDYVPWGYGGNDTTITPQEHVLDKIYNGNNFTINLDSKYKTLTGKTDASDFIAGGRKVIVSAWVENVVGGMVVRLSD